MTWDVHLDSQSSDLSRYVQFFLSFFLPFFLSFFLSSYAGCDFDQAFNLLDFGTEWKITLAVLDERRNINVKPRV